MQATQPTAPTMELTDPVFDDMAMSDMADRRIFRDAIVLSYHQRMKNPAPWARIVFEDWKVFLSLVIQGGWVHVLNEELLMRMAKWNHDDYEIDEDHRICKLSLYCVVRIYYPFSKGIHRLDHLEHLIIDGEDLTSFPLRELNSIQKLERLEVWSFSKLLSDSLCGLQETEKLHRVKILELCDVHSLQLLRVCPSVEKLIPEFRNSGDTDAFLNFLGSIEIETLQSIDFLHSSGINGEQLAKFMLEIVPRFPNLAKLCFSDCCTITDFQVLSDRLQSGQSRAISNSLSLRIHFDARNTHSDFMAHKKDMLNLLKFFPTIESIHLYGACNLFTKVDPDWRYAVVKNSVGRRIFRGGGSSRLPLSVWPIVLERAQRKVSGASLAATGIYYLLRKGSALIGRRDLVGELERPPPSNRQKRA